MIEFHGIWIEQCKAARDIKEERRQHQHPPAAGAPVAVA